jgi:replicative DNA helicase
LGDIVVQSVDAKLEYWKNQLLDCGEIISGGTDVFCINNYPHDDTEPKNVFSVVDADSSQQDAILFAQRGESFVLQGPPGTGKSQTITNIIAELVADGKKVLFVSEKMAALEVVHKRLKQVGLEEFCLTLHNHNAKKRDILNQFEKSMNLSRQTPNYSWQDANDNQYRLKEARNALNQYHRELHTPVKPLEKTIYQINGCLAQLESHPNIDYIETRAESFTQESLSQCKHELKEITRIVSESGYGYQNNNPWNGYLTEAARGHLGVKQQLESLLVLTEEGFSIFSKLNSTFGTNQDWALDTVEDLVKDAEKICDVSKRSPGIPSGWLSLDLKTTAGSSSIHFH